MGRNPIDALLHRIKRRIHLQNSGTLFSRYRGEGFDFAEIMPYVEGMDAKRIFWKGFAKGVREPQIKSYHEERQITICVAALLSGSLLFGAPVSKHQKLIETVAMLMMAAHSSANPVQGYCFTQKERFVTPAHKEYAPIEHFLKRLAAVDPLYTHIEGAEVADDLFRKIRTKSLLILVGDFLAPIDLRTLAQKHEVVALIVRDRFEAQPVPLGETVLIDPETGEEAELFFDARTARAYKRRYEAHDAKLLKHLRSLSIRHRFVYTDEDPFTALMRL